MHILFIGDIFGQPGREIAQRAIPALVKQHELDLVIANVENSAAGFGVTGDIAETILKLGRGRHDVRQSRLGQEGGARVHSTPAQAAPPGELPRRRPGARHLDRQDAQRRADRGHQRHGPRSSWRRSTIRLPSCCARSRRLRAKARVILVDFHAEATPRNWRWAGISTAASRRSSAPTRTCRPPTSASCRKARRTSPTSA